VLGKFDPAEVGLGSKPEVLFNNHTSAFTSSGHATALALVRKVPCVDGSELARTFFTQQTWSVQPCVRPLSAVHMTAGHNALRGSGPGQKPAFEMQCHECVVLIAGTASGADISPLRQFGGNVSLHLVRT
jgi:hypothetical protein